MTGRDARRFAAGAVGVAVASWLLLIAAGGPPGDGGLRWSLLGWAIMASAGVAAGSWMVAAHGRPGIGFIGAMGGGMLARLFASTAAALWAAQYGIETVSAYLAGLAAGYVPLQVFEVAWFFRRARVNGLSGNHD